MMKKIQNGYEAKVQKASEGSLYLVFSVSNPFTNNTDAQWFFTTDNFVHLMSAEVILLTHQSKTTVCTVLLP
jgi:hypothetical protein